MRKEETSVDVVLEDVSRRSGRVGHTERGASHSPRDYTTDKCLAHAPQQKQTDSLA
jgi:hypothetical protein